MSYVALLFIMLIATIGGLLDGVAEQTSGFSSDDEDRLNRIVAGASIATVDDADLAGNPTNTAVSSPGVADRAWWQAFWEILSWDLSFLIGPLQIVRTFLMMITGALSAYVVFNVGSNLFGLIRNAG